MISHTTEKFRNYILPCLKTLKNRRGLPILNSNTIHIIRVYNSNAFIPASLFIQYESTLIIGQWVLLIMVKSCGFGLVLIGNMKK